MLKNNKEKIPIKYLNLLFIIFIICSTSLNAQTDTLKKIDQGKLDKISVQKEIIEEEEVFRPYKSMIIKNIGINTLEIASPFVNKDTSDNTNWFLDFINSLHFNTKDWVVKNYVLFEPGDTIDPAQLSDTERLLRTNESFIDSRVKVFPIKNTDSADVRIITQDRWTLTPIFSYNTDQKLGLYGLKDYNFLGFGHTFEVNVTSNERKAIGWGTELKYLSPNIIGTFINGGIEYRVNKRLDLKRIFFDRAFVTNKTRWVGGIDISWKTDANEFVDEMNNKIELNFTQNRQDIWIGRTFPVFFGEDLFRKNTNFTSAFRIKRLNYSLKPKTQNLRSIFSNNMLYLFSFGLINRKFYKDFYVDKFGITEDIPIGGAVNFITGKETRETTGWWYFGGRAIYSKFVNGIGYVSGKIGWGGFKNENKWERNVLNLNVVYHSNLFASDLWKYRFFMQADYLLGFNRFVEEQIYLDSENGIRGIPEYSIPGKKRVTLNLEARVFSPFEPLGFVLGGIAFADFGMIADENKKLHKSRLFSGYGIGLRTRNESISEAVFNISLVYNPFFPGEESGSFSIVFTSSILLGKRIFDFSKPTTVNYINN